MKKLFNIFLCLFPILDIYSSFIPSISVGELSIIGIGILIYLNKKRINITNLSFIKLYGLFFLLTIIAYIVNGFHLDNYNFQTVSSYMLYAIIIVFSLSIVEIDFFSKMYIKIANFICYFTIFQFVMITFFNIKIIGLIPGLSYTTGSNYSHYMIVMNRVCGVFTEPAHLVQYLAIGLVILVFKESHNYKNIILFVLTMLLTYSGNGILLLLSIVGVKLWMMLSEKRKKTLMKVLIIVTSLVISFIILINFSPEFYALLGRIDEITGKSLVSASGYLRVIYGYDVYKNLDFISQIIGIGLGNFHLVAGDGYNANVVLAGTSHEALLQYRNGIQTILIDSGLIGLILYLIYLFKNRNKTQRYIIMIMITLQLVSSNFNTVYYVLFIVIIESIKNIEGSTLSI